MTELVTIDRNWFQKISLETQENEDGSMNLLFSWDENDPDLQLWTDLGEEKQAEFVLKALKEGVRTTDLLGKAPDSAEQNSTDT